jgi:hypothetical protein
MKCDKQDCCHRGKRPECFITFFWLCKEFREDHIGGQDEDVLVLQEAPFRCFRRLAVKTLLSTKQP